MMKNIASYLLLLLTVLIIAFSCTLNETTKGETADTTLNAANNPTAEPVQKVTTNGILHANDSLTNISVSTQVVWITGKIKPNQHPSFKFNVTDKDSIIAEVKPAEANGNVRISQIEMPDKSMDGPFGNDLHYATKGNGSYRIILAQNMMAGEAYTGDYYLLVKVK